ncbi:MAG TPA: DUF167 domain-containing protein [Polyangiaceae bacterium]|nr:DUF167 domain-containing protein [Polyangiaceae bacterium]
MAELDVQQHAASLCIRVRVTPRASRSRVLGVREGVLAVAVAAPPVDGAANSELVRTLARHFEIPQSQVSIVAGGSGRSKLVRVARLSEAELLQKIPK